MSDWKLFSVWLKSTCEYERLNKMIGNMYPRRISLSGLSFAQRRQYWIWYNDTLLGIWRQFSKKVQYIIHRRWRNL